MPFIPANPQKAIPHIFLWFPSYKSFQVYSRTGQMVCYGSRGVYKVPRLHNTCVMLPDVPFHNRVEQDILDILDLVHFVVHVVLLVSKILISNVFFSFPVYKIFISKILEIHLEILIFSAR